jgi:hypothetical protein
VLSFSFSLAHDHFTSRRDEMALAFTFKFRGKIFKAYANGHVVGGGWHFTNANAMGTALRAAYDAAKR